MKDDEAKPAEDEVVTEDGKPLEFSIERGARPGDHVTSVRYTGRGKVLSILNGLATVKPDSGAPQVSIPVGDLTKVS